MTDAELEDIDMRAAQATPGPWEHKGDDKCCEAWVEDTKHHKVTSRRGMLPQDAWFIANARTDIPALIAEVRRLRLLNERHEGCLDSGAHCKYGHITKVMK